jgi:hypothetical protein
MHTGDAYLAELAKIRAKDAAAAAAAADSADELLVVPRFVDALKRGRGRPTGAAVPGAVRAADAVSSAGASSGSASGAGVPADNKSIGRDLSRHKRHNKSAVAAAAAPGRLTPVKGAEKDRALAKARESGKGEWKCRLVLESLPLQYLSDYWEAGTVRQDIPPIVETEVEYKLRNIKQEEGESPNKRAKEAGEEDQKPRDWYFGVPKPSYSDSVTFGDCGDIKPLVIGD